MFLVAVGKPIEGFDGKVGCFRVSSPKIALRTSKYRKYGEKFEAEVTMNLLRLFLLLS